MLKQQFHNIGIIKLGRSMQWCDIIIVWILV
jgi:hypothetical protein